MKILSSKGKHTTKRTASKRTVDKSTEKVNNKNLKNNAATDEAKANEKDIVTDIDATTEKDVTKLKKKSRFGRLSTQKKVILILVCVLGLSILFGASTVAVLRWRIEPFYSHFFRPGVEDLSTLPSIVIPPPDTNTPDTEVPNNDVVVKDEPDDNLAFVVDEPVVRDTNHVNFLLFGIDAHGNTDVIMLASYHSINNTLEVVSIPRDTVVNVSWDLRKVNSIHAYMRNQYRSESDKAERDKKIAEATIEHFRNILGFHADYMITVTFGGFRRIIDTVGPISYNVPAAVNVDGVRVQPGLQKLNGTQALAVMRSRNSYANHAIGRDYAQQGFMQAIASTVLSSNWNASKIASMVDIFFKEVNSSSIPVRLQIGFANDFLRLKTDNINFSMMPGAIDTIRGNSYITILVPEWLELINEKFNPFSRDITINDVSILTRGSDRRLYVTDGNWQGSSTWGANSLGPTNPSLTTDSSRPIPGRAPATDTGGDRNPVTGGTGGGDNGNGGDGDGGGGDGGGGDGGDGGDGGGGDGGGDGGGGDG